MDATPTSKPSEGSADPPVNKYEEKTFYCETCELSVMGREEYLDHLASVMHRVCLDRKKATTGGEASATKPKPSMRKPLQDRKKEDADDVVDPFLRDTSMDDKVLGEETYRKNMDDIYGSGYRDSRGRETTYLDVRHERDKRERSRYDSPYRDRAVPPDYDRDRRGVRDDTRRYEYGRPEEDPYRRGRSPDSADRSRPYGYPPDDRSARYDRPPLSRERELSGSSRDYDHDRLYRRGASPLRDRRDTSPGRRYDDYRQFSDRDRQKDPLYRSDPLRPRDSPPRVSSRDRDGGRYDRYDDKRRSHSSERDKASRPGYGSDFPDGPYRGKFPHRDSEISDNTSVHSYGSSSSRRDDRRGSRSPSRHSSRSRDGPAGTGVALPDLPAESISDPTQTAIELLERSGITDSFAISNTAADIINKVLEGDFDLLPFTEPERNDNRPPSPAPVPPPSDPPKKVKFGSVKDTPDSPERPFYPSTPRPRFEDSSSDDDSVASPMKDDGDDVVRPPSPPSPPAPPPPNDPFVPKTPKPTFDSSSSNSPAELGTPGQEGKDGTQLQPITVIQNQKPIETIENQQQEVGMVEQQGGMNENQQQVGMMQNQEQGGMMPNQQQQMGMMPNQQQGMGMMQNQQQQMGMMQNQQQGMGMMQNQQGGMMQNQQMGMMQNQGGMMQNQQMGMMQNQGGMMQNQQMGMMQNQQGGMMQNQFQSMNSFPNQQGMQFGNQQMNNFQNQQQPMNNFQNQNLKQIPTIGRGQNMAPNQRPRFESPFNRREFGRNRFGINNRFGENRFQNRFRSDRDRFDTRREGRSRWETDKDRDRDRDRDRDKSREDGRSRFSSNDRGSSRVPILPPPRSRQSNSEMEKLMRLVNAPRSYKQRLQIAKILRAHQQRTNTRFRLSKPGVGSTTSDPIDGFKAGGEINLDDLSERVKLEIAALLENELANEEPPPEAKSASKSAPAEKPVSGVSAEVQRRRQELLDPKQNQINPELLKDGKPKAKSKDPTLTIIAKEPSGNISEVLLDEDSKDVKKDEEDMEVEGDEKAAKRRRLDSTDKSTSEDKAGEDSKRRKVSEDGTVVVESDPWAPEVKDGPVAAAIVTLSLNEEEVHRRLATTNAAIVRLEALMRRTLQQLGDRQLLKKRLLREEMRLRARRMRILKEKVDEEADITDVSSIDLSTSEWASSSLALSTTSGSESLEEAIRKQGSKAMSVKYLGALKMGTLSPQLLKELRTRIESESDGKPESDSGKDTWFSKYISNYQMGGSSSAGMGSMRKHREAEESVKFSKSFKKKSSSSHHREHERDRKPEIKKERRPESERENRSEFPPPKSNVVLKSKTSSNPTEPEVKRKPGRPKKIESESPARRDSSESSSYKREDSSSSYKKSSDKTPSKAFISSSDSDSDSSSKPEPEKRKESTQSEVKRKPGRPKKSESQPSNSYSKTDTYKKASEKTKSRALISSSDSDSDNSSKKDSRKHKTKTKSRSLVSSDSDSDDEPTPRKSSSSSRPSFGTEELKRKRGRPRKSDISSADLLRRYLHAQSSPDEDSDTERRTKIRQNYTATLEQLKNPPVVKLYRINVKKEKRRLRKASKSRPPKPPKEALFVVKPKAEPEKMFDSSDSDDQKMKIDLNIPAFADTEDTPSKENKEKVEKPVEESKTKEENEEKVVDEKKVDGKETEEVKETIGEKTTEKGDEEKADEKKTEKEDKEKADDKVPEKDDKEQSDKTSEQDESNEKDKDNSDTEMTKEEKKIDDGKAESSEDEDSPKGDGDGKATEKDEENKEDEDKTEDKEPESEEEDSKKDTKEDEAEKEDEKDDGESEKVEEKEQTEGEKEKTKENDKADAEPETSADLPPLAIGNVVGGLSDSVFEKFDSMDMDETEKTMSSSGEADTDREQEESGKKRAAVKPARVEAPAPLEGRPPLQYKGHSAAIHALCIWEDFLFTASEDSSARKFKIETGECLAVYEGHKKGVQSIVVAAGFGIAPMVFTGSFDNSIRGYNVETSEREARHKFAHRVLCLHHLGGKLYIGLGNGSVACLDIEIDKVVETFRCAESPIKSLATGREGARTLLVAAANDCTVTVRDISNGLLIRTIEGHTKSIMDVKVVQGYVYTAAVDKTVQVHELNTGDVVETLRHKGVVTSVCVNNKSLYTAGYEGLVRCFNLKTYELYQLYYGAGHGMISAMTVHENKIITANREGLIEAHTTSATSQWPCQFGLCTLVFGLRVHLEHHVVNDHLLPNQETVRCLWTDCTEFLSTKDGAQAAIDHFAKHFGGEASNSSSKSDKASGGSNDKGKKDA